MCVTTVWTGTTCGFALIRDAGLTPEQLAEVQKERRERKVCDECRIVITGACVMPYLSGRQA